MDDKENKTTVTAQVTPDMKRRATQVFESMGLDRSTAINMFLIKAVRDNKLPFIPEGSPLEAAVQAVNDGDGITFNDVQAARDYLNSNDDDDD
ncbi:type II toxin-antitoxin system RelB/DinJ family antitoxin [Lacticaseibacillus mingshuiensis]|uniref:Type II toxin-antitoxin system RelB/DinJ family antitoxin n=1 Tax=Lacticaseibacillus mingshuiensis TaxID=2799574 RepID=A0ABW4CE11_9LACO|nr:type II toxin-antitoxin system RelB/DinJ family antitoxin [Lacticaseibacillus mingshuiensis]